MVNFTSRPPRVGEINGRHYHFLSKDDFKHAIDRGEMLEYEVMSASGRYYGTSKTDLELLLQQHNVICDKMPIGALNLKKHFGSFAVTIFVDAPDDQLSHRLLDKSRVNEKDLISKRLEQANAEREYKPQFDYNLTNIDGKLDEAAAHATKIILDKVISK